MTPLAQPVAWGVFRDEAALLVVLAVMFAVDLLRPRGARSPAGVILLVGSLAVAALSWISPTPDASLWGGVFLVDPLARFMKLIFMTALALSAAASLAPMSRRHGEGEYYLCLGASTLGMMLVAGSGELVSLFVALELTTISLYLLTALLRGETASQEAGLKYLLIGAFSAALFLFGASLLYAVTGTTVLAGIRAGAAAGSGDPFLVFGLVLVLAAVGFKIAAVPFHMWAPDVYQAAPTAVVGFASTASKAAGFTVLIRLILGSLGGLRDEWTLLLSVSAALTLVVGSFVALPQTNIKRLLAYSSIAQAGYLLIGFLPASERGLSSVLFYLLVYLFTNLGAFLVVAIHARQAGGEEIADFAGLARRSPLLALALMLSLLSLAGIPPLGGFVGKLYLFAAAMEYPGRFLWLVVLAVLLSIVSLFYYLQVVRQMYIEKPKAEGPVPVGRVAGAALFVCTAMVVLTGLVPGPFLAAALEAARSFFAA